MHRTTISSEIQREGHFSGVHLSETIVAKSAALLLHGEVVEVPTTSARHGEEFFSLLQASDGADGAAQTTTMEQVEEVLSEGLHQMGEGVQKMGEAVESGVYQMEEAVEAAVENARLMVVSGSSGEEQDSGAGKSFGPARTSLTSSEGMRYRTGGGQSVVAGY